MDPDPAILSCPVPSTLTLSFLSVQLSSGNILLEQVAIDRFIVFVESAARSDGIGVASVGVQSAFEASFLCASSNMCNRQKGTVCIPQVIR